MDLLLTQRRVPVSFSQPSKPVSMSFHEREHGATREALSYRTEHPAAAHCVLHPSYHLPAYLPKKLASLMSVVVLQWPQYRNL